jgi:hypothetical protein
MNRLLIASGTSIVFFLAGLLAGYLLFSSDGEIKKIEQSKQETTITPATPKEIKQLTKKKIEISGKQIGKNKIEITGKAIIDSNKIVTGKRDIIVDIKPLSYRHAFGLFGGGIVGYNSDIKKSQFGYTAGIMYDRYFLSRFSVGAGIGYVTVGNTQGALIQLHTSISW